MARPVIHIPESDAVRLERDDGKVIEIIATVGESAPLYRFSPGVWYVVSEERFELLRTIERQNGNHTPS